MTRRVTTTLALPEDFALALGEVAATGPYALGVGLNTLYRQHRGSLISNADPDGILTAVGDSVTYRVRTFGRGNRTEGVRFRYLLLITVSGGGPSVSVRVTNSAGSYVTKSGTANGWYESASNLVMPDNVDYEDLTVSVSSSRDVSAIAILAVEVHYTTGTTELESGVDTNGFVGLDTDWLVGEAPCSVARIRDMHTNALILYETRVPMLFATARLTPIGLPTAIATPIPEGVSTVEVWAYCATTGPSTSVLRVSFQGQSETVTIASGWNNLTITVAPTDTICLLKIDWLIAGGATLTRLSAWCEDV